MNYSGHDPGAAVVDGRLPPILNRRERLERERWSLRGSFRVYRLDQRTDIAKREGVLTLTVRIDLGLGNVIRQEHPLVAKLFVELHRLVNIHVAIIRVHFLKVEIASFNVPEMDHE